MNENTGAFDTPLAGRTASGAADRAIAGLAIAAPLAYLALLAMRPYPGDVVLKTSMCVLLAALAWRERERLLALALVFSAAGDAFLGIDGERLFIPGLASFLLTQVLYAAIFMRMRRSQPAPLTGGRKLAIAAIVLFAIAFAAILFPNLGGLAIPVVIYMIVIVTMAVLAQRVAGWAVPVGAVTFVASDSLLALAKFLWSAPWVGPAVWITYALAQLLIVYGLLTAVHPAGLRRRPPETSAAREG